MYHADTDKMNRICMYNSTAHGTNHLISIITSKCTWAHSSISDSQNKKIIFCVRK